MDRAFSAGHRGTWNIVFDWNFFLIIFSEFSFNFSDPQRLLRETYFQLTIWGNSRLA
jgi:hypothetical protein